MSSLLDGRHVHGVRDETALQRCGDLLGDDHARAVLGLLGRCGEVRREDDVVQLEQRSRVRLGGEDVERGTGDLPGLERLQQRVLVDELTARGVDDADAVPGSLERAAVDGRARLVGQRQVQRDDVGRREDGLLRSCSLHAQLPKALSGDERVEGDDPHAERQRAPRDLLTDPSEAEQPQGLARQLLPAVARALPAARLHRRMRLRNVPPESEQEPDRVLGGRDDGRLRRVDDEDALPCRGLDVDVVDAHAGAADHAEPLGPLQERCVELRPRADDDRLVVPDDVLEPRVEIDVHLEAGAEEARRPPPRSAP